MQNDPSDELPVQTIKQRQIAEQYLTIEQSTELITQLVRLDPKKARNTFENNTTIEIKSIVRLIVQQTYLVYTAFLKKINILISEEIYTKPTSTYPQAYCQYLLQIDLCRYTTKQQEKIRKTFTFIEATDSHRKIVQYICSFIINTRKKLHRSFQKMQGEIECYILRKQFNSLQSMIEDIILPQVHKVSLKALILSLEESEIFRQHSLLVKCLNNSIFTKIYFHSKNKQIFKSLIQIQSTLAVKNEKDHTNRISTIIQQLMALLLKNNIIGFEQSLKKIQSKEGKIKQTAENHGKQKIIERNTESKPYILGNIFQTEHRRWKYCIKIDITQKPFKVFSTTRMQALIGQGSKALSPQQDDPKQSKGIQQIKYQQQYPLHVQQYLAQHRQKKQDYVIEFTTGNNLLTVKYITNIQMTIERTDFLMFQSNYLAHILNNVSLQYIHKENKRYLVVKIVSYLQKDQKFILKLLVLLDSLMVYAKVINQFLSRKGEQFKNTVELSHQCEHIKRLFISKIQKVYQSFKTNQ